LKKKRRKRSPNLVDRRECNRKRQTFEHANQKRAGYERKMKESKGKKQAEPTHVTTCTHGEIIRDKSEWKYSKSEGKKEGSITHAKPEGGESKQKAAV